MFTEINNVPKIMRQVSERLRHSKPHLLTLMDIFMLLWRLKNPFAHQNHTEKCKKNIINIPRPTPRDPGVVALGGGLGNSLQVFLKPRQQRGLSLHVPTHLPPKGAL